MILSLRRALLVSPLVAAVAACALSACGETYVDLIDDGLSAGSDAARATDSPATEAGVNDALGSDGGCTVAAALPASTPTGHWRPCDTVVACVLSLP